MGEWSWKDEDEGGDPEGRIQQVRQEDGAGRMRMKVRIEIPRVGSDRWEGAGGWSRKERRDGEGEAGDPRGRVSPVPAVPAVVRTGPGSEAAPEPGAGRRVPCRAAVVRPAAPPPGGGSARWQRARSGAGCGARGAGFRVRGAGPERGHDALRQRGRGLEM